MTLAAGPGQRETEAAAVNIQVRGVVRGVGFPPFVYRLAPKHRLAGLVLIHSGGVELQVEGPAARCRPLAAACGNRRRLWCIVALQMADLPPGGNRRFEIRDSRAEEGRYQLISPDIATCADFCDFSGRERALFTSFVIKRACAFRFRSPLPLSLHISKPTRPGYLTGSRLCVRIHTRGCRRRGKVARARLQGKGGVGCRRPRPGKAEMDSLSP